MLGDEELVEGLQDLLLALCRSLAACRELQAVLQLLAQASSTVLGVADQQHAPDGGAEAPGGQELQASYAAVAAAAAAAAPGQSPADVLRPLFYASPASLDLAETLLTGGRVCCAAAPASAATAAGACPVRLASPPHTSAPIPACSGRT